MEFRPGVPPRTALQEACGPQQVCRSEAHRLVPCPSGSGEATGGCFLATTPVRARAAQAASPLMGGVLAGGMSGGM
jgi:hypothetical protein